MKRFAVAALWCASTAAHAYHAGDVFDKPPGAGGGGGVFYAGAPLERRWDCSACHVGAEGRIKLSLTSQPASLLETLRYAPGQSYTIVAQMVGEHLGFDSPKANFNAIAVELVDGKGLPAGALGGFSPNDLYLSGNATVASAGKAVDATSWSFTWTAPPVGTGQVGFFAGVVDGNGAGSGAGGTLTDPFGDDVFVGALHFDEGTKAERPSRGGGGLVGVALFALFFRRRRGRFGS